MMSRDMPGTELSERQKAVLKRLDQRIPIKVIAADLEISESRVNQHIRALKKTFGVNTLPDLIARARKNSENTESLPAAPPYRNPAYRNAQVHFAGNVPDNAARAESGDFELADVWAVPVDTPWASFEEPSVVPGSLDGTHSILRRLVVMVGMAAGLAAAVILVITAAVSIEQVLDGMWSVPESYSKPSEGASAAE